MQELFVSKKNGETGHKSSKMPKLDEISGTVAIISCYHCEKLAALKQR